MKTGKSKAVPPVQREAIGLRIAALRNAKSESSAELAAIAGVTRSAVSQWENGITVPRPEMLRLLAEHFEVTVDYLLNGPAPAPPGFIAGLQVFSSYLETEIAPLLRQGGECNDAGNCEGRP